MTKKPRTIILTGSTDEFFPYTRECVDSLIASGVLEHADLGILEHCMTPEQIDTFKDVAQHIVRPDWTTRPLRVPEKLQKDRHLSLVARSDLRNLYPGYDVYLWFDADAWCQTTEFFDVYVKGAMESGLSVAKEDGFGYSPTLTERRWWIGNYFLGFGLVDGFRGGVMAAPINIGLVAIHHDAPHWDRYRERHQETIDRSGKINLDQHSCHATLALDGMPATYVSARHNWLPILSRPVWDAESKLLCDPGPGGKPLSVIHLAGPGKRDARKLRVRQGGFIETAVDYPSIRALQGAPAASNRARKEDVLASA